MRSGTAGRSPFAEGFFLSVSRFGLGAAAFGGSASVTGV